MGARRRALVVLAVAAAVLGAGVGSASALIPGDSVSITSISSPDGHLYVDYPFSFNGGGSVTGEDPDGGDYEQIVLFTPASSSILQPSCPTDYVTAAEAVNMQYGSLAAYESDPAVSDPFLLEDGPYTYTADVNDGVLATVTTPGRYVACAYLGDDESGDTFAVTPSPTPFTVSDPPGSSAPTMFGGPPSKTRAPVHLGLSIHPQHSPIRAPGRNLLEITGRYDATSGPAGLTVTVKPTSRYNGCASNDEQDEQVTRAENGAVLTFGEKVTPGASGRFSSPIALNFRKRFSGTAVVCAYLVQGVDDLAVGYLRFSADKPVTPHAARVWHPSA
jgi:hypothetical protein